MMIFLRPFYRILLAAMLVWVAARPCAAGSYLECLEKAQGKEVRWSGNWSPDKLDHDMMYKISSVSIVNRIPKRSVTLTLRALGSAVKRERVVTAEAEDTARSICERFEVRVSKLEFPENPASSSGTRTQEQDPPSHFAPDKLPFLKYSSEGWVRDYPPNEARLVQCEIGRPSIFALTKTNFVLAEL
jgi:hypothetical protein